MKEEQESSWQATQESAAGQTRTKAEKGGGYRVGRGRGQPGGSFILDGLACQVFSSLPRHGWGLWRPCLPGIFFMTSSWAGPPITAPSRIEPRSPTLQVDSLPAEPQRKPNNTGVGSLSLLQRIFPAQELNQGLLHCRQILYQLSYEES